MKTWSIASWQGMAVGFALGWIVFKRPQWATNLIEKIKAKIGIGA